MWPNLNSSVLDSMGNEIMNHIRTSVYIRRTSALIGQILRENKKSFSWLMENKRSNAVKDLVYDKYIDRQDYALSKVSIPGDGELDTLLDDPEAVIAKTVAEKNITEDLASNYVNQILELERLLATTPDHDGNLVNDAFDSFYNHYIKNTDIDVLRDDSDESENESNPFDTEEVRAILKKEEEEDTSTGEDPDAQSGGDRYGVASNEEKAFDKASKQVQNYFRVFPIVKSIKDNGELEYYEDELGIPYTYDYASVFNKAKTYLAGKFTIEKILEKLSNTEVLKAFPSAKLIFNDLTEYMNSETPENFSFTQSFRKVMSMPEIDNRKLKVNYDALNNNVADRQKTVVQMRSLSRTGEMAEIGQWQDLFTRPAEDKKAGVIDDQTSFNSIFNGVGVDNIIYNIGGVIKMNPFYDYNRLHRGMTAREFLPLLGIKLNDKFWDSSLSKYADRVKSLIIHNLLKYKEYTEYQLAKDEKLTLEKLEEAKSVDIPSKEMTDILVKRFINNPIELFREEEHLSKEIKP